MPLQAVESPMARNRTLELLKLEEAPQPSPSPIPGFSLISRFYDFEAVDTCEIA
jgi:hypothetical protein